ncbi:hypothetical protein [Nitrospira sp. Ecomares 2.1]
MGQANHSRADRAHKASALQLRTVKKTSWIISLKKVFRRSNPQKTFQVGIHIQMPMSGLVVNFGRDDTPQKKKSSSTSSVAGQGEENGYGFGHLGKF